ncbi:hypothetical protein DCO44_12965, partial [Acinetobacter sp. AM]
KGKNKDSIENMNMIENLANLEKHRLAKIRNHLEHRSFRIIDDFGYELSTKFDSYPEIKYQELLKRKEYLEYHNLQNSEQYLEVLDQINEKEIKSKYIFEMPISEFELSLMNLARNVRNSLMYLSLAVHYEERKKPIDSELVITKVVPIK